jgi:hypothetical protein
MTYTINGKEYTEFDINLRCAELLAWESEANVKSVEFDGDCFWVGHLTFSPYAVFKPFAVKDYCNNAADTDAIIDKCWDDLTGFVFIADNGIIRWNLLMNRHNCTKLVAACICYIEINEAAL